MPIRLVCRQGGVPVFGYQKLRPGEFWFLITVQHVKNALILLQTAVILTKFAWKALSSLLVYSDTVWCRCCPACMPCAVL